jgi:N-formylglutamate amidohydrolase
MSEPMSILGCPAAVPLIGNVPHASTRIPDDICATFAPSPDELAAEVLRVTDHFADGLFSGVTQLGGVIVRHDVSRLVVDPERFEDDAREVMAQRGQGVIYTHTSDGRRLRKQNPSPAERRGLLAAFYHPYHAALASHAGAMLDRFGRCLILDCHSFPQRPLPCELDQAPDRPDICLGTDPYHTSDELVTPIEALCARHGLAVARNAPFAGTYVPAVLYHTEPRLWSLMIEVNRHLYVDESTGRKLPAFAQTHAFVTEMIAAAADVLKHTR